MYGSVGWRRLTEERDSCAQQIGDVHSRVNTRSKDSTDRDY